MAHLRFFFDDENGQSHRVENVALMPVEYVMQKCGRVGKMTPRKDAYMGYALIENECKSVAVNRIVHYKSNPTKHSCDSRCLNAKGRMMNCECSCGGANHGKGF